MKYLKITGIVLLLLTCSGGLALAEVVRLEGHLMPLFCDKRDPDRGVNHTTECALKAECVERGFGLWTAEEFTKFDAKGNELALQYFQTTEREKDHRVRVVGDFDGEILHVRELLPVE